MLKHSRNVSFVKARAAKALQLGGRNLASWNLYGGGGGQTEVRGPQVARWPL